MAHDALERVVIRRERFGHRVAPRPGPRMRLVVGGLIAIVLAALVVAPAVVVSRLVAVAVTALVVRALPAGGRGMPDARRPRPRPARGTRRRRRAGRAHCSPSVA